MITKSRIKTNLLLMEDLGIEDYLFEIKSTDNKNTRKYYKDLSRMIEGHFSAAVEWLDSEEGKKYYKEEGIYKREAFESLDEAIDEILNETKLSAEEIIERIFNEGKKYGYNDLDKHLRYSEADKHAITYARSYNYNLITNLSDDLKTSIKNEIVRSVLGGRTIGEIQSQLYNKQKERLEGTTFTPYQRAAMIARTETSRAKNTGILQSYVNEGVRRVKVLTAEDSNVCTTCLEYAYNYNTDVITVETRAEDKSYEIKDLLGDHPCLPMHPNCRCTYVADTDSIQPLSYDGQPVDLTPPQTRGERPDLMYKHEMDEFFRKYGYVRTELPPKIEGFFTTYTTGAYKYLNQYLRGQLDYKKAKEQWEIYSRKESKEFDSCDFVSFEEALEISKKMDKYAKVLKEDILVARGETKRYIKPDEYGEYRDKAPLSTSLDVTVPLEFGEELSYIILPKGTKVSPLNRISEYNNEMEVLLPENSLLKYIDECPNYDKNGKKSKSAKIFKLITT